MHRAGRKDSRRRKTGYGDKGTGDSQLDSEEAGADMNIEIKFNVGESVTIPQLHKDIEGVVIGIWITEKGITYLVRYLWMGKAEEVYFYARELEAKN
jgi:hypothetical protein